MNRMTYLKGVVTLHLDQAKCVGCGACLLVCPHAVFAMTDHVAHIENRDACMECGACSMNCPVDAICVQTGVGCANAVIKAALGRKGDSCCCVIDTPEES